MLTKKFIKELMTSFKDDESFDDDDQYGFVPNTYDELSYDLHEYPFLFVLCTQFLEWGDEQLKRKNKRG